MHHFNKTLSTLQELMEKLEIGFHYERLFMKHEHDY